VKDPSQGRLQFLSQGLLCHRDWVLECAATCVALASRPQPCQNKRAFQGCIAES
jgi:hypothetical protein